MTVGRITFSNDTPIFVDGGNALMDLSIFKTEGSMSKPIVTVLVVIIIAAIAYKYRGSIMSRWNTIKG